MTYNETAAVVYRIIAAYPQQARYFEEGMVKGMVREWHEGLKALPPDGVMEAVTALTTEQKWMPSLSEVISKILDMQYGDDAYIIRELDRLVSRSSNYIIFGQVTEEQERGYENLSPFQKLIIRSPYEFNKWLMQDHEWKEERVNRIKREVSYGRHKDVLEGKAENQVGFNVFKALEERKKGDVNDDVSRSV